MGKLTVLIGTTCLDRRLHINLILPALSGVKSRTDFLDHPQKIPN